MTFWGNSKQVQEQNENHITQGANYGLQDNDGGTTGARVKPLPRPVIQAGNADNRQPKTAILRLAESIPASKSSRIYIGSREKQILDKRKIKTIIRTNRLLIYTGGELKKHRRTK
jgi:hypothetical protein